MHLKNGWHLPDLLSGHGKYMSRAEVVPYALHFSSGRRRVVQAGGHIGTFPVKLSQYFEVVECFEPVASNWECMVLNTLHHGKNIFPHRAALSDANEPLVINVSQSGTGGHHVTHRLDLAHETVQAKTIDSFKWNDVDAIFLDVEGYESYALKGARRTIELCHPLIVAEINSCRNRYAGTTVEAFLRKRGYSVVGAYGEDLVFAYYA